MKMLAVAAVAVLGGTAATATLAVPQDPPAGQIVVAQLASAAPLVVDNEVKIDGVVVGKVHSLDVGRGVAEVAMALEPSAFPLHRDARVTIRAVSLLGERYLDLERGSPQAPLLGPREPIPLAQTASNVGVDEIFNILDKPTSAGLAHLVTTFGDGLRGNGPNADAAIRALAPSLRDTQALTKVLRDQNTLINTLVERVEPVAGALAADDGKAMDQMVGAADRLLAASAAQDAELEKTLAELPSALESANTTLGQLERTANGATPTLAGIRPVTDDLDEISHELTRFADSLDPALASIDPVLERAESLLGEARPVAEDLRNAGPGFRSSMESVRPIVAHLTSNLDNVLNFVRNWALTTNGRDGLSHYFRAHYAVNEAAGTGLLPNGGPLPPLPLPNPQARPDGIPTVPGLLAPPRPAEGPNDSGDNSATGLSPDQERGMTGFLLGGGS